MFFVIITMTNLNRISNVLPCRNKGHADEEDNEGGSVVQLERKVVNRSWVCLPKKIIVKWISLFVAEKVRVRKSKYLLESQSETMTNQNA